MTTLTVLFYLLSIAGLLCSPPAGEFEGCGFISRELVSESIHCGYLQVPEDYDEPLGKQIQIAYAVLKARDASNAYPMIFFSGGPGSASLTAGEVKNWLQSDFRNNRDIILFDQRGINHSSALPNMEFDLFRILAKDINSEEEYRLIKSVIADYRQRATMMGIGLKHYNSFENARDVGVLMDHLGYKKYNLLGASYGTRLARIVQDLFPGKIHSVILDSPNPLGDDFLIARLEAYAKALQRIFNYCQESSTCSRQYPALQQEYIQAIQSLEQEPFKVVFDSMEFVVNSQDAIYLLRRALYGNNSRVHAPALIRAFRQRQPQEILRVLEAEINLISDYNSSMWISVERYETFNAANTPEVIDSIYRTMPLLPVKLGLFSGLYLAARDWHDSELSLEKRMFRSSSIPTIIFVNQYDPVTPPENGRIMQKTLSDSRLFILDEGGHVAGNWACRMNVITAFMDRPSADLETGCLNLVKP